MIDNRTIFENRLKRLEELDRISLISAKESEELALMRMVKK